MKKRKNTAAKIMAGIALFAIVVGIVGTGAIVIVNSFTQKDTLTKEQIEDFLKSQSGTTVDVSQETPVEDEQAESGSLSE